MMKYIPQSAEDRRLLLQTMGAKTAEEFFQDIPEKYRIKSLVTYPPAQSEMELKKTFGSFAKLSSMPMLSFAGCGIYQHSIPSVVPFLQSRSEFSTAYTPYQPEISQGLLQAIFEYQTLACELTECELSNASLLDGATALAEGVLMALRIKKNSQGKIFISGALHPFYKEVLETYCVSYKERMVSIPLKGDQLDENQLQQLWVGGADILVTQSPNIFGVIENYPTIGQWVKASNTLWVTSTMEPLSWALLRGGGAFGAHIVTAEGQSFGNAPFLGGSSFGIFCTKQDCLRQLPGRLVGETVDEAGKRSYTLTFATREQFIRRAKATSNICTNQNLNMLGGLVFLATLGKQGLRELALQNFSKTEYLKEQIKTQTKVQISSSPTFNEFVVEVHGSASEVVDACMHEGWVCGVDLGQWNSQWKQKLLIHVNENHDIEQMQKLVQTLSKFR